MATRVGARLLISLGVGGCYAPSGSVGDVGSDESSTGATTTSAAADPSTAGSDTASPSEDSGPTETEPHADGTGSSTSESASCGNGEVEVGEACDDGDNDGSYGGCMPDCTALAPHCGDAIPNGDEACDDGDAENGNGCNIDCIESGTVLWTVNSSEGYEFLNASTWDRQVAVDDMGNAYVIGPIVDGGTQTATLVRKFSTDGDSIWELVYDPASGFAAPGGIGVGAAGEVVYSGTITGPAGYVRRLSSNGALSWSRSFNGLGSGSARGLAVDVDESAVVGGRMDVDGMSHAVLVRYDAGGMVEWRDENEDVPHTWEDVAIDDSGDVYACGGTTVRRHTTNGTMIWSVGWGTGACYGVTPTEDGGAIAVGSDGNDNARILRIDDDGDVMWSETYDALPSPSQFTYFVDVAFDGVHATAIGSQYDDDDREIVLMKYDLDGDVMWSQTATGGGSENAGEGVDVDPDGNIYASGYLQAPGGAHLWLRKMAP